MPILVDLYDSRSLTQAINKVSVSDPFLIDKFFGTKVPHDSDKVDIEIYTGSSKIANFVNANEPTPRPIKNTTKKVETITIPRTFESKTFTAHELKDISVIGDIYGSAEAKKAAQADYIARELADLKERVLRLREKMAADAIGTGKFSVSQANIAFDIDFGFVENEQLFTLSGATLWSASTGTPLANLRLWKRLIQRASLCNADTLILGTNACNYFMNNDEVKALLDLNNYKVGSLDLDVVSGVAVTKVGRVLGIDVYEYYQQYTSDSDVVSDMVDVDRAILSCSKAPNRVLHGPAYRFVNGNVASINAEFYIEVIADKNNTMLQWNCEQKSIPTIHDPGAFVSAKVV